MSSLISEETSIFDSNCDQMKSKGLLFVGIFLLVIGILLRKVGDFPLTGLILILSGVTLKTIYIIAKIRSGAYKPGREMLYLFIGLALFMTGLNVRDDFKGIFPLILIVSGLALKIIFIVKFILITRAARTMKEQVIE